MTSCGIHGAWFRRWLAACMVCLSPVAGHAGAWTTGGLTFSDELGGVRILGVSGNGSRDDPIILIQEMIGAGPAVLIIHNDRTGHLNVSPAIGFLTLSVVTSIANQGPWAWSGFDLELWRTLDQPSVYTDGLSFDQPQNFSRIAKADRFEKTEQEDEPFDRIRFDGGRVEPASVLQLDFDIVDANGTPVFYLVQRPIVLFAQSDHLARPDSQWQSRALDEHHAVRSGLRPSRPRPRG